MSYRRSGFFELCLATSIILVVLVTQTRAATITVTSINDSGAGSLRQAILDAGPGDEILFAPGLDGHPIYLTSGELVIDKNLTITGRGEANTIVDGNGSSRVFEIDSGTVAMSGMAIRNGSATYSGGGGILITMNGTLSLVDSTVSGNDAAEGGGILNAGTLMTDHCTISDNTADTGGGIHHTFGTLTLDHSFVNGNSAEQFGGGIYHNAPLNLVNTTVNYNTVSYAGGGIAAFDALTIDHSTLAGNVATIGGGIFSEDGGGPRTIDYSTISNNTAATGAGVLIDSGPAVTLTNSTIRGNSASGLGAGLTVFGFGAATVNSSTISGNLGIGISIEQDSTVTLNNSTISGNTGFGIEFGPQCTLTLKGSLVASQSGAADCHIDYGMAITSQGYNLDSDDTCGLDQSTDLRGVNPLLGPLQDNLGPTWTHALLTGSPAIDSGSCPGLTTDQRGYPRPVDNPTAPDLDDGCDIGAFELQWPPLLAKVESFTAELEGGAIRLTWRTRSEIDNVGFRVLRARARSGRGTFEFGLASDPVIISPQLILPRGNELSGAEYEYLDTDRQAPGVLLYYLEDVDVWGRVTRHGPVTVRIKSGGSSEGRPVRLPGEEGPRQRKLRSR